MRIMRFDFRRLVVVVVNLAAWQIAALFEVGTGETRRRVSSLVASARVKHLQSRDSATVSHCIAMRVTDPEQTKPSTVDDSGRLLRTQVYVSK